MSRFAGKLLAVCISSLVLAPASPALAGDAANEPGLTAEQIVEKNIAARGGLDAWRKVQAMIWTGHIESPNAPAPSLPFVLEMKRPDKTRFEIKVQGQPSTRIYDGAHGWKVRASARGKPEVAPYTAEELGFAKDAQGLDGPLLDYRAKGIAVSLDGMDEVEGRRAYRLKVTLPSGTVRRVWIDTRTFLEIKYDREVRNALGQAGTVSVFYRDYRTVEGLQMPFTIESGMSQSGTSQSGMRDRGPEANAKSASKTADKMVIDRVVVNPALPDVAFAKPGMMGPGNMVSVDAVPPQAAPSMPRGFPRLNRPGLNRPALNPSALNRPGVPASSAPAP